ncbi:gephyrin-like molybdotransferase Glp [Oceaniglobus indicus]|uniref:molybdopterin molybdotransferase MoeA n=1 Tax=Oceaniglobus indicus TaxID=2047749 RepID=UPI000C192C4C|nr:gephyrin-like molybdotransferase Glp [Oceaniglobus indicus]
MTLLTRIDELGCGCGASDQPGALTTIDDAIERIKDTAEAVRETQDVPLAAARGRVLAEPVLAHAPTPPFDNAAMDGYAINSASLTGAGPWHLPVTARVAAGQNTAEPLSPGSAARIFTGAPMPDGADVVLAQESVQRGEAEIIVTHRAASVTHVRPAGEDMKAGDVVVPAGRRITARDIAACAAAGCATVRVRRPVRVALVVTGDEIAPPGQPRRGAGIWDVNTPMLRAALDSADLDLTHVETARDDRAALQRQLGDLAGQVDLVITTGGISVGEEDHVKPALTGLGVEIAFSGVAMKPGKPVSYGRLGRACWLGLPGNPLSAFVTWQVFGTVLCRRLTGDASSRAPRRNVVLSGPLQHKFGRCELRLAKILGCDGMGREIVEVDEATHSGRVAGLPTADGVILIPREAEMLAEGALVEFLPFDA